VIRAAVATDVDVIVDLEAACQGVDAWSAWLVRDGVEGGLPTVRYLVADSDDGVVGYAVASFAGDIAELQRIGVTAAMRRSGIATALLDEVVAEAPAAGRSR
jgi:[ribosomal protein S18]-alanine N-acetyltransferase